MTQTTVEFDAINEFLKGQSWLLKENANQNRSYSQMKGFIAGEAIKKYVLSKYPSNIRRMHQDGYIHIHDISGGIVPYCMGADFLQLITEGLWTQHVVSGPPKHFSSALNQAVNFLCASQQEWMGAQALNDFNTILAPFIASDNLSYDEVKQGIQEFIWDLNYPTRSGSESPFTNVMFNTKCPKNLREIPVPDQLSSLGGNTYADFHDESMTVLRAFNDVFNEGDHNGTPFTFPIASINLIKSTDFSDPVWMEIAETEAKYGSYYFSNFIGSGIDENSTRALCCRLSIDLTQLPPAGGRWAFQGSTGSIGITSLNMGKLGFISHDIPELLSNIRVLLDVVKEGLLLKNEWCQDMYDMGLLPLTKYYGVDFNRYFRTIGIIGLHEMTVNMTGNPIWEEVPLVQSVLEYIRDWTRETQIETGKLWNLEQTPGEGAATRLAMLDRKNHPGIFTQGTDSGPYYTTLMTPPNVDMSVLERMRVEEELLPLFTGGTVHRVFLGESAPSPGGLLKFTMQIAKNTKIPYYDFAATFGICRVCGRSVRGYYETCDECGGDMDVYARIVGYYRKVGSANIGKVAEIRDRKYVSLA